MTEKQLGLVMTDELYLQRDPDYSTAIVLLFPYGKEEWLGGYLSLTFDEKPCTELHIRLKSSFPSEMQQEYLKHFLKRGLLLDVTVDGESVCEKILNSEEKEKQ